MTEADGVTDHTPSEELGHAHLAKIFEAMEALKAAGNNGASWFFWIAGLSLVNTVIAHAGGESHFIVGLAITAIVDAIASGIGKQNPEAATPLMMVAIGFSVFVAVICLIFGWLSRKRLLWIFGIGMFLYLLDGLLYLLIGDYLSAAFHGYALYSMITGFNAFRQLNKLESALVNATNEDAAVADDARDVGFETT
ncbi:MAG: hypothetical protein WCH39_11565 [Schlesneria sp.]